MVRLLKAVGLAVIAASSLVVADNPASCGEGNKCPEDTPCCSREWTTDLDFAYTHSESELTSHGQSTANVVCDNAPITMLILVDNLLRL